MTTDLVSTPVDSSKGVPELDVQAEVQRAVQQQAKSHRERLVIALGALDDRLQVTRETLVQESSILARQAGFAGNT